MLLCGVGQIVVGRRREVEEAEAEAEAEALGES